MEQKPQGGDLSHPSYSSGLEWDESAMRRGCLLAVMVVGAEDSGFWQACEFSVAQIGWDDACPRRVNAWRHTG